MYTRFATVAVLGFLASKTLAQDCNDYNDCPEPNGGDPYGGGNPYGGNPYGGEPPTTTFTGDMNAYSEYPDVAEVLEQIAPQVTSISPAQVCTLWGRMMDVRLILPQADALENDINVFYATWTISNSVPDILSSDVDAWLPTSTMAVEQVNSIDAAMEYPTDPVAMSVLAALLSGVPSSSAILAYESAASFYQNAYMGALSTVVNNDLAITGTPASLASLSPPTAASTGLPFISQSSAPGFLTKTLSFPSGSSKTALGTATSASGSSAASASGSSSSSVVSSGFAAPTAGPQLVYSAVAAAAGIIGMVLL